MHATVITTQVVQHTAQLANIPLREDEVTQFADGFTTTMVVVDQLRMVDTAQVEPTFQVTGLTNIWREDEVDTARMFSQQQAVANALATHAGYFVVPQIIAQEEL